MNRIVTLGCAVFLSLVGGPAHSALITFDELADMTPVTTQYQALGVVFANATAITAGISLDEFEFPPVSGANVVYDQGGPITLTFVTPIASFGGFFTYAAPLEITAFDATGVVLADLFSQFSTNLALSGAPGSSPNEFLGASGLHGVTRIVIHASDEGTSFTLDDLTFAVPEPATAALAGVALLALLLAGPGRASVTHRARGLQSTRILRH